MGREASSRQLGECPLLDHFRRSTAGQSAADPCETSSRRSGSSELARDCRRGECERVEGGRLRSGGFGNLEECSGFCCGASMLLRVLWCTLMRRVRRATFCQLFRRVLNFAANQIHASCARSTFQLTLSRNRVCGGFDFFRRCHRRAVSINRGSAMLGCPSTRGFAARSGRHSLAGHERGVLSAFAAHAASARQPSRGLPVRLRGSRRFGATAFAWLAEP